MNYLLELGFDKETIDLLKNTLPENTIKTFEKEQENITNNINYLKNLGVKNYMDAFIKFYNMFLLDTKDFDDIFNKYDNEDLIAKLEKNVAIMEYL